MSPRDLEKRLARRALRVGVVLPADVVAGLAIYLQVLARWNLRINLTSLKLEPVSDEAIDRLIIEPVAALRQIRPADRLAIDIGSGGGSPGIPLGLIAKQISIILVEVKVRKSAFLREAVRTLGLVNIHVENKRFEELLARSDLHEAIDIVTLRAVRPDPRLWTTVEAFLKPGGRLLWFGSSGRPSEPAAQFSLIASELIVPTTVSHLRVVERRGRILS